MDLNLNLDRVDLPTRPVEGVWVRELRESDLALLEAAPKTVLANVKRLSLRHHALARAIAFGQPYTDAARQTGYTTVRITQLMNDPAFKELVEHYRSHLEESFADMGVRLAALGHEAIDVLQERLENEPEIFDVGSLRKLVEVTSDRIGFGAHTSQTNVNVNVNMATRLEAARRRVEEKVIEHANSREDK